jgi:NAD-dependent SIR2 family protein deacetylase
MYGKLKKKRCWGCKSLDVIKWGKRENKQRFKCKNCGLLFTRNRLEQRLKNRFVWFEKWILERQTYKTLTRYSGYSKDTLQRTFYAILEQAPSVKIIQTSNVNLRMDVTYFKKFCLVCYQDNLDGYTQLIRITYKEDYLEIKNI